LPAFFSLNPSNHCALKERAKTGSDIKGPDERASNSSGQPVVERPRPAWEETFAAFSFNDLAI
jgi:hypothetical protein